MVEGTPVTVVTGASRGVGRGVAVALGAHGHTVYVTGRAEPPGGSTRPGTLQETADAVTAAGGRGVAVRVDHRDDDAVAALFDRVRAEVGRLDVLVNNVALVHDAVQAPGPFWEKPLWAGVDLLDVGVRSSYVSSYHAAPLLAATAGALVVFTSAPGAVHYQFDPAYGAHKAALDKFAADMAVDFAPVGVTSVSLWLGAVLTDRVQAIIDAGGEHAAFLTEVGETPEFAGHVIAALHADPALRSRSGRTLIAAEVAREHGITDRGGRRPPSFRDLMRVEPVQHRGRLQ